MWRWEVLRHWVACVGCMLKAAALAAYVCMAWEKLGSINNMAGVKCNCIT